MRAPNRLPGPGSVLVAAVVWLLAGLPPAGANANPLPPGFAHIHLQPVDDDFCAAHQVHSCADVTPYLDQTGRVEFDVFFECFMGVPEAVDELAFELVWPAGWGFVDFEDCTGGTPAVTPGSNSIAVEIVFDDPRAMPAPFFLVGRVVLDVTGPGEASISEAWWREYGLDWYLAGCAAWAGPPDCWCWHDCTTHDLACGATFVPSSLEITVPEGEEVQGFVEAWVRWRQDGSPCFVTFSASDPWMQVDAEWIDEYRRAITVTVDGGLIGPGTYAAEIHAESVCTACLPVTVIVTGAQPVPGDEPQPETRRMTWGLVKGAYRR